VKTKETTRRMPNTTRGLSGTVLGVFVFTVSMMGSNPFSLSVDTIISVSARAARPVWLRPRSQRRQRIRFHRYRPIPSHRYKSHRRRWSVAFHGIPLEVRRFKRKASSN